MILKLKLKYNRELITGIIQKKNTSCQIIRHNTIKNIKLIVKNFWHLILKVKYINCRKKFPNVSSYPWRWRLYVSPKCWRPHGFVTQRTNIFTTVRISDVKSYSKIIWSLWGEPCNHYYLILLWHFVWSVLRQLC